nr:unnamed protein product [Callosobruchus chinensis]
MWLECRLTLLYQYVRIWLSGLDTAGLLEVSRFLAS